MGDIAEQLQNALETENLFGDILTQGEDIIETVVDGASLLAGEAVAGVKQAIMDKRIFIYMILMAVGMMVIVEVVNWFFLYRKTWYVDLVKDSNKKLELYDAAKNTLKVGSEKNHENRLKNLKSSSDAAAQQLQSSKMKVGAFANVMMLFLVPLANRKFAGFIAGRLPFQPFFLFKYLAHQGLTNPMPTDCSPMFVYILCTTALRPIVQRFMQGGADTGMGF